MPIKILYVCTGNIYRSPMAEAMTNYLARERGLHIEARSVGMAQSGEPVSERALSALGPMQDEVADHTSQPILREWLDVSDLILGMERLHVREVAVISPDIWTRSFTLKEFVRRAEQTGPRNNQLALAQWIKLVGVGRSRQDLLGSSPEDDMDDPVNKSAIDVKIVAKEIRQLVEHLLAILGAE